MKTDATMPNASAIHAAQADTFLDVVGWVFFTVLRFLASLRLTVALFGMAIFIVFTGTLAQTSMDIWQVTAEYFRTPVARIPLQIFCQPVFGLGGLTLPGSIYFPGGWAIGTMLAINLLAAHTVRFKIQASGSRLVAGICTLAVGCVLTWLVIASGFNKVGTEGSTLVGWDNLWILIKLGLVVFWFAVVVRFVRLPSGHLAERWLLVTIIAGLTGLLAWLFLDESATLGDSSMRILWQLIKGSMAGLVMLAGCVLIFKKRAGIVLIHGGIGLMMLSELLTGTYAVEGNMMIREGATGNYSYDIREMELAVVDSSPADEDRVSVIPESLLTGGEAIESDQLPFDIEVVEFFDNAVIMKLAAGETSPATAGAGLFYKAIPQRLAAGTDTGGGRRSNSFD